MHLEEKKGETIWEYRIDKANVDSSGDQLRPPQKYFLLDIFYSLHLYNL
jgi:hypothetical protein